MKDIDLIADLESNVSQIAMKWTGVTSKKMFGCPAFWTNDNVFAMVWKHGRIGVKLTEEKAYETLLQMKGAEPWKAGPMKMAHWVLVPAEYNTNSTFLKKWLKSAYEQNESAKTATQKNPAKTKRKK